MKLTRLRLLGFKSFVEATDFLIEPGLTGVVGPNGCGKSNLVEALRWVMGETSHKSMRAADMDDVIFSGNNGRPARNNAEVGLAIDNTDRTAPAQFNGEDTLQVSRRIEREQGSTYRVNGKEVRARDVQTLFADASTGARSPALVHQGRIGEIIQAKPEQRRRVLEEAAGIAGLHVRRHEAELRLKAAEQNLARLEDVIGQLTGQIDGLKRQARQAVRYRNVAEHVRKAEATLFHLRFVNAQTEVSNAAQARDLAVRAVAEHTGRQAEAATAQAEAAAALPAMRDAEARAAAALQRLTIAREALEREEARAKDRMAELVRRLIQLGEDIGRETKLAADAEAAVARLDAEKETLAQEATAGASRRGEVDARVTEATDVLAAAEKTFGELTGALADLTARRNQLEGVQRDQADRVARLDREMADVEEELKKLDAERSTGLDIETLSSAVERAQSSIADAEVAALRAEAAHSSARQALDVARAPFVEAERRVHRLETEAKTLAKLLHVDTKQLWPPVIDLLTVTKGFETALGAALGDDLDAGVEANAPMRWAGAMIDAADPGLPSGAEPLAKHVVAPSEMARRLAQIGVVDRAQGAELAKQLKPGQRLVSREGDLWRWDGFAVAANAPTGAARRLAERNRLNDIEAEVAMARAELETRRHTVALAQGEVATAAEAEASFRTRWRDQQHEADAARDAHTQAERENARVAARHSALAEGIARLGTNRAEAEAARNQAARELEALPATDQLAAVEADAGAWNERRAGAASQIATLQERLSEAKTERAGLEDAPQLFAEKRSGLIDEVPQAEAARRTAAATLANGETLLAQADRAARAALEAMGTAREDSARAEERHAGALRRLADVGHEIR